MPKIKVDDETFYKSDLPDAVFEEVTTEKKKRTLVNPAHELATPEEQHSVILSLGGTDEIFDAHCRYLSWRQTTEGVDALLSAMSSEGVGFAALTGCPLKKCWVESSGDVPPTHHLHDDGDLYFYSMTDALYYVVVLTSSVG